MSPNGVRHLSFVRSNVVCFLSQEVWFLMYQRFFACMKLRYWELLFSEAWWCRTIYMQNCSHFYCSRYTSCVLLLFLVQVVGEKMSGSSSVFILILVVLRGAIEENFLLITKQTWKTRLNYPVGNSERLKIYPSICLVLTWHDISFEDGSSVVMQPFWFLSIQRLQTVVAKRSSACSICNSFSQSRILVLHLNHCIAFCTTHLRNNIRIGRVLGCQLVYFFLYKMHMYVHHHWHAPSQQFFPAVPSRG